MFVIIFLCDQIVDSPKNILNKNKKILDNNLLILDLASVPMDSVIPL